VSFREESGGCSITAAGWEMREKRGDRTENDLEGGTGGGIASAETWPPSKKGADEE